MAMCKQAVAATWPQMVMEAHTGMVPRAADTQQLRTRAATEAAHTMEAVTRPNAMVAMTTAHMVVVLL